LMAPEPVFKRVLPEVLKELMKGLKPLPRLLTTELAPLANAVFRPEFDIVNGVKVALFVKNGEAAVATAVGNGVLNVVRMTGTTRVSSVSSAGRILRGRRISFIGKLLG
jgi:hypothetical protein